jgi:hypothetical protein
MEQKEKKEEDHNSRCSSFSLIPVCHEMNNFAPPHPSIMMLCFSRAQKQQSANHELKLLKP